MALIFILYGLIILALVGIAIYEHITISTLSLPVSPALGILTILLPLLSPLTTLLAPRLFNPPRHPRNRHPLAIPQRSNGNSNNHNHNNNNNPANRARKPPTTTGLLPALTQLAQLLLTTVLTTLYTSTLATPTTTDCLLDQRWRTFWTSHDARAIRTIQDALGCCGFRSTRDKAWPFPPDAKPDTCQLRFDRHEHCLPGWEAALKRAVGGELGVVLAVGALQVLGLVLARRGGFGLGGRAGAGEGMGWMAALERLFTGVGGGRDGGVEAGSRRPLLAGPEQEGEANGNGGRVVETGYQDISDHEETEEGDVDGEEEARPRTERLGYSAARDGPRVEPAHHDPWAGVQRG
ncbi:hypothetical protein B0I37DRAFT_432280 [Chaetomium sp. MPI-CAGE-AT-0009]|nr:hypothetical protein B0I37DRAFT_432280 [Chaetomium sp. MPI-CAGE-AT-0009]